MYTKDYLMQYEYFFNLFKTESIDYALDSLTGVINKEGNAIINPKYEDVKIPNPEKDLFVCYTAENNTTVLNKNSEEIKTPKKYRYFDNRSQCKRNSCNYR